MDTQMLLRVTLVPSSLTLNSVSKWDTVPVPEADLALSASEVRDYCHSRCVCPQCLDPTAGQARHSTARYLNEPGLPTLLS